MRDSATSIQAPDRAAGNPWGRGLSALPNGKDLRRLIRRVVIFVLGTIVLLAGFCMIILPGPAFLVIPAGLAILATEFLWARRILHAVRDRIKRQRAAWGRGEAAPPGERG